MNIQESNKLIFDFMGCVHSDDPDIDRWEMGDLQYHGSWRQLMPVVEKISEIGYCVNISTKKDSVVRIHNGVGMIGYLSPPLITVDEGLSGWTLLETIYSAVIKFIQWYNEFNSQPSNTTP